MLLDVFVAIALLTLIVAIALGWKQCGPEELRAGLVTISATFLGVVLAVVAAREEGERQERAKLCRMVDVSRAEIAGSLEEITGAEADNSPAGDDRRQVLQDPATALRLLAGDAAFLDSIEASAASELLAINTRLWWRTSPQSSSGWPPPPLRMPKEMAVRANLAGASALLDKQRAALCEKKPLAIPLALGWVASLRDGATLGRAHLGARAGR